jgi:catalase (peroxidase I)
MATGQEGAKNQDEEVKYPAFRFVKPERRRLQKERRLAADDSGSFSNQRVGDGGCIPEGGYEAVREELKLVLTDSQTFWPADDFPGTSGPHYGGLFIRLAWHCNGSYRLSDGRGGCDGGNIRFDPEANWPDNASLDMARKLLEPVKEKFGSCLSWGDLIVLAGDTAIESMGGPVIGFCGGRIDNPDGNESYPLGPSPVEQELMPCGLEDDGQDVICPTGQLCFGCENPLGAAAMGLIYVNPEGVFGMEGQMQPAADSIRDVFGRMGFGDRATVATIGGGHAFGKCHGACEQATPGFCPSGQTWEDKRTSGLELVWTTTPTTWGNFYFTNMFAYNWTNFTGPGGALQWKPEDEGAPDIGMLTTDLALINDPEYEKISREYAADNDLLTSDFGKGWYQLMSRDMGPRSRCLGDELPELQEWESKLAKPRSSELPDYIPIRSTIQAAIDSNPEHVAAFASLAMACSSTFRATDYRGGCNGARIRFQPESEWPENVRLNTAGALDLLEPIKEAHPDISYADLIVLAGQTAIEHAGGRKMNFCGGRTDDDSGADSEGLAPMLFNNNTYASVVYRFANQNLGMEEGVALFATPCNGNITTLSNQYFIDLSAGDNQNGLLGCYENESVLLEGDLKPIVDDFAADNDLFLEAYARAWNYMATSDLFNGPQNNACEGVQDPTLEGETPPPIDSNTTKAPTSGAVMTSAVFATLATGALMVATAL